MKKKTAAAGSYDAPPLTVLVMLGSLAVHVEELLETPSVMKGKTLGEYLDTLAPSAGFDLAAIHQTLLSPEVLAWREQMDARALLPKKRH